jgi:hypothetical protein
MGLASLSLPTEAEVLLSTRYGFDSLSGRPPERNLLHRFRLGDPSVSGDAIVDMLLAHPVLINRLFVVTANRAAPRTLEHDAP